MTAAELPLARKNALSHRGQALRALIARLRERAAVSTRSRWPSACRPADARTFAVAAAAVAVRAHSVVRAQVPVLRLQLARGARRRCRRRIRRRAARRPRAARCRSVWGRTVVTRVLRRRHAEPVLRRRRSTACSAASARALPLAPDAEITLEANPGHVRAASKFAGYRAAGVNRLSLGMQSFDDAQLQRARPHPRRRRSARARSSARAA